LTTVPALLQRIRDIVDALYKCMILTYLLILGQIVRYFVHRAPGSSGKWPLKWSVYVLLLICVLIMFVVFSSLLNIIILFMT